MKNVCMQNKAVYGTTTAAAAAAAAAMASTIHSQHVFHSLTHILV